MRAALERAACRRCWWLSYESRQERNYKLGRSRWGLTFSPIMGARIQALGVSERRAEAAEEGYAERRQILSRSTRE